MMIHTIEEAISRLRYVQLDNDYSPREILLMVLAGGSSQPLYNIHNGRFEPAIEFLCKGTRDIAAYPIPGGLVREDHGRPFFARGSAKFPANDHLNEFLGTLAVAGIHFQGTDIITDKGTEGTLADMADAAMESYLLSEKDEQSWSLQLFAWYPGITKEWKNAKGEGCSAERILNYLIRRPYGAGAAFGTYSLAAVSFAVSRFCLEQDVEPAQLEGTWKEAYEYVAAAVSLMKKNQRDDGSLDRAWFRRKSFPGDRAEFSERLRDIAARRYSAANAIVYPTGHCLDAISPLALFLSPEQEWIAAATYIVAQTIEMQWIQIVRDIPSVTHAIHALKLIGE